MVKARCVTVGASISASAMVQRVTINQASRGAPSGQVASEREQTAIPSSPEASVMAATFFAGWSVCRGSPFGKIVFLRSRKPLVLQKGGPVILQAAQLCRTCGKDGTRGHLVR